MVMGVGEPCVVRDWALKGLGPRYPGAPLMWRLGPKGLGPHGWRSPRDRVALIALSCIFVLVIICLFEMLI